jgi:hypothetical protein
MLFIPFLYAFIVTSKNCSKVGGGRSKYLEICIDPRAQSMAFVKKADTRQYASTRAPLTFICFLKSMNAQYHTILA